MTVTPLQLATAYLTIASGGLKREATLLRNSSTSESRVLDPVIANHIKLMLKGVVDGGTGVKAGIKAYDVAG